MQAYSAKCNFFLCLFGNVVSHQAQQWEEQCDVVEQNHGFDLNWINFISNIKKKKRKNNL